MALAFYFVYDNIENVVRFKHFSNEWNIVISRYAYHFSWCSCICVRRRGNKSHHASTNIIRITVFYPVWTELNYWNMFSNFELGFNLIKFKLFWWKIEQSRYYIVIIGWRISTQYNKDDSDVLVFEQPNVFFNTLYTKKFTIEKKNFDGSF